MPYKKQLRYVGDSLAAVWLFVALVACAQATPERAPPTETAQSAVSTSTPSLEATATAPLEATATTTAAPASPTAQSPTSTSTPPPAPSATPSATLPPQAAQAGDAVIVDHTSLDQFDDIPGEYVEAAARLRMLVRHASVGHNVDNALNCLMDDSGNAPNFCDRDLDESLIVHDSKYDRSNWNFEFHATPNANPGWNKKVSYFIERADELQVGQNYDAMINVLAYLDGAPGSTLDDLFFSREQDDEVGIVELEALLQRHPDTEMIWTTLALARIIGGEDSARFNEQLREYVRQNGGYLLDIADIESHAPDGAPCVEEEGDGYPVLCPQYTRESRGGHLNALGSQRVARALWILMARFAGWQGN